MRPVRRFEVRQAIPEALAVLPEVATNLHWSWDAEATRLKEAFARQWSSVADEHDLNQYSPGDI